MIRIRFVAALIIGMAIGTASALEPISPLPEKIDVDADKVALGKKLFMDPRLSANGTVSCHSCHTMEQWGADGRAVSIGINGQTGRRNSPTVFNAALNFRQFWDGRAANLEEQALMPILDPVEMGFQSLDEMAAAIASDPEYKESFTQVFDGEPNPRRIADALAEFQKTLITPDSAFDQYLRGDADALTERQKTGYELFKGYGCVSCHQGQLVGGNMFQKFGALKDIQLRSGGNIGDLGRYEITGNEWDKYVFKVPSLRLVSKTAPYFHDGSAATLQDAVDVMLEFQVSRDVPTEDRDAIIDFLGTLAGTHPLNNNQD